MFTFRKRLFAFPTEKQKARVVPMSQITTFAQSEKLFIGISGLIGAGKTTLAQALSTKMNLPLYCEPVIDNVYLADFYQDPKRYAFNLQVYLLNERFRQHQQIIWNGKGGVQDRTIYEDGVFAKVLYNQGMIDKRDYDTYLSLFANMANFMKKNNLIVHLDVSAEESLDRIKMRARDCESTISLDYLKQLHAAYEEFLIDISRVIPVLRVKYSEFKTAEEMANIINEEFHKMQNIKHIH